MLSLNGSERGGDRIKKTVSSDTVFFFSGEAGIRTLGPASWSTVFETAPFDHSGTSPFDCQCDTYVSPCGMVMQRYDFFLIYQKKLYLCSWIGEGDFVRFVLTINYL